MFIPGKIYILPVYIKTSPISLKIAVSLKIYFFLKLVLPPPPPFLPNNLTYLLSGIGQLSQISTGVTFKIFFSLKLVFPPLFFFFDKETLEVNICFLC